MPKLALQEDLIDQKIGEQIRARRTYLGLSQAELADRIGMSFQQVQKYERGSNRIASSILLRVAAALDCSASYLLNTDKNLKSNQKWLGQVAADKDLSKFIQRFYKIQSPKARSRILFVLDALLHEVENASKRVKAKPAPANPKKHPSRTPPQNSRRNPPQSKSPKPKRR